jgi:CelD/BcsL family acetyltransferase involved in cellulose biosynthesis
MPDSKTKGIAYSDPVFDSVALVQGAPTAKTAAATLTLAEMQSKIVTVTHAVGSSVAITLPTGTTLDQFGVYSVDQSFDWTIINLSAAAADIITLTAAAGHTIVGVPIVVSAHSSTGELSSNAGMFRTRKTAPATYVTYRIA